MHRIKFKYEKEKQKGKIVKELPNWNICSLYLERQLIKKDKKTKYLLPFDSIEPTENNIYIMQILRPGSEDVETYELNESCTLIGRDSMCDVQFKEKIVSGQHFVIQYRNVRLEINDNEQQIIPYIFDLGSKNGTFIDGKRIPSKQFVQLLNDDKITFDETGKSGIIGIFQRTIN